MHDTQTALSPKLQETLMDVANNGVPRSFGFPAIMLPLVKITMVDSKDDPRVQLADVTAGFARDVAGSSLSGTAAESRLSLLRSITHPNPIWRPGRSWEEIRPR